MTCTVMPILSKHRVGWKQSLQSHVDIGGVSRPSDPNISKIPQVVAKNSRLTIKGVS